ncbi:hypothetical protein [Pseudomonas helleri]|uniref:hypothetical protein n=1 Tax=Pseudomonas helleri TaxID=1608996 RepID=UPI003340B3EF
MSEMTDRQWAAIELLETAAQTAHDIVNKPADATVQTGSGPSPTLLALAKMITDLAGGLLLPRKETVPSAGTVLILDVAYTKGVSFFDVTLDKPQCLLNFLNTDVPAGYIWSFTVRLRQGTGVNKVTFPAKIRWVGNRPPVLAYEAGAADVLTFMSDGGGWLGFSDGSWFDASVPA